MNCRISMRMLRTWWTTRLPMFLLGPVLGIIAIQIGCTKLNPIAYQAPVVATCQHPVPTVAVAPFPLSDYQPLPIEVLEEKFRREPFTILEAKSTDRGTTGAMRLKLQFGDCSIVQVKWKMAASKGEAYNNSPRKQLAAYAFQKLFLAPKDYVVPVTAGVCIPAKQLAAIGVKATPQVAGTNCVFGLVAVWLNNVKVPAKLLDRERFAASVQRGEPDGYAWHIGNFNLFTYLISHRDARKGNFLVSNLPDTYHVFSIDNDLAFSGLGNPLPWVPIWRTLKVKTLPRPTIERLRTLTTEQMYQHLGTFAEFRFEADGSVTSVAHFSDNFDPHDGMRSNGRDLLEGRIAQVGLTRREIDKIATRLRKLLKRVDEKEIELVRNRTDEWPGVASVPLED